ncbi:MAG: hypothetical protein WCO59_00375, partial [Actinomycetes bacterium]
AFLAGRFLAAAFLAGRFLAAAFLAGRFLAAVFFAAFFAGRFAAAFFTDFLAVRFAAVFLVARFAVFLAGRFAAAFFAATSSSQICRAQPVAERVAVHTVPRIARKRHHNWEIFPPRVANIFCDLSLWPLSICILCRFSVIAHW